MESISNGASFELQRIMERALDAHDHRKQTGSQLGAVSWLDALRKRVERAEDQILAATSDRERDHATIRYETVRDILSSFERRLESASNEKAQPHLAAQKDSL